MNRKINFKNINPLNNKQEISLAEFVAKKVLAYWFVFIAAMFIGEAVIIAGLMIAGFNPLQGDIPTSTFGMMLPEYGFIIYAAFTILYCRIIEKTKLSDLGLKVDIAGGFLGCVLALVLLAVVMAVCCLTGSVSWVGIQQMTSTKDLIIMLFAFVIQSGTEELMVRGFLMNTLRKRTSVLAAVLVSATMFAIPHLPSMLDMGGVYVIVGIVNLYLVSAVLSDLVLLRNNIWAAWGLHTAWNFVLYGVLGLPLSGGAESEAGIFQFANNGESILNGGGYGVEASIITTAILAAAVAFLMINWKKDKNGI